MKNIKSFKEYINESISSIPEIENEESIYSDPADLGDGRKEVNLEDLNNQQLNVQIAQGRPPVVAEMKNNVNSEDIDGIEHRAKAEIDRFKTFIEKQ